MVRQDRTGSTTPVLYVQFGLCQFSYIHSDVVSASRLWSIVNIKESVVIYKDQI